MMWSCDVDEVDVDDVGDGKEDVVWMTRKEIEFGSSCFGQTLRRNFREIMEHTKKSKAQGHSFLCVSRI